MKCKECGSCRKGWFRWTPNEYVCIGVPEPFIIEDINAECTEYEDLRNKKLPTEDCLVVSFDKNPNDSTVLLVSRVDGKDMECINMLWDEEALEVYKKLLG